MADISALADSSIVAHRTGNRTAPGPAGLSREEILAVQAVVSAALGPVAGFKVAAAPVGPPVLAPIQARYVVADGGARRVRDTVGIELEVGFELIAPLTSAKLPARPERHFRPRVVLELVETRLSGDLADRPDLKFADFQINAGMVVGGAPPEWDGSDFGTVRARLVGGGGTVVDGEARVPGGSALANLELLLTNIGDHCGGLRVGQTVITGSLCGLPQFGPGSDVSGWIEGLGAVAVRVRRARVAPA